MFRRRNKKVIKGEDEELSKDQDEKDKFPTSQTKNRTRKLLFGLSLFVLILFTDSNYPKDWKHPSTYKSHPSIYNTSKENAVHYHLIFSTSCSKSQTWQSYAFFYHANKSGQLGNVTQIVSGCSASEKQKMIDQFQATVRPIPSSFRFQIHFTPDYSRIKPGITYQYFNKPFGVLHWMEHVLGYNSSSSNNNNSNNNKNGYRRQISSNPIDDSIIMLLDPDQLILKPLIHDYTSVDMRWVHRRNPNVSKIVKHKSTMAQQYGYGNAWLTSISLEKLLPKNDTSSPLWKLNRRTAQRFAAGPPYLATARDMYDIVRKWVEFVPKVHEEYPELLAEMFAYNLAAHHLSRRPLTSPGFMVSDVTLPQLEGWYWLNTSNKSIMDEVRNNNCPKQWYPIKNSSEHPFILHYCQAYRWNGLSYFKREMDSNFLSCSSNLLQEEPSTSSRPNLGIDDTSTSSVYPAYALCVLTRALNEAAEYYKLQNCPQDRTTNYKKIQVLRTREQ